MSGQQTKKKPRRGASSKWAKTIILKNSERTRGYVPLTRPFSEQSLRTMLKSSGMVYMKPVHGSHGIGVMRIESKPSGYRLQLGSSVYRKLTWQGLLQRVKQYTRSKRYLVQRGIHMLRHQGRMFDLRIVTQLDRSRQWCVTGKLARVAKLGSAVTNGSQGASIRTFETVMSTQAGDAVRQRTEARLNTICLTAAKHLQHAFPHLNELGFDIALDQKLHPWILEVNSKPEAIPFSKLQDRTMYRRILRYRKLSPKRT